jgi:hypothetical protein
VNVKPGLDTGLNLFFTDFCRKLENEASKAKMPGGVEGFVERYGRE